MIIFLSRYKNSLEMLFSKLELHTLTEIKSSVNGYNKNKWPYYCLLSHGSILSITKSRYQLQWTFFSLIFSNLWLWWKIIPVTNAFARIYSLCNNFFLFLKLHSWVWFLWGSRMNGITSICCLYTICWPKKMIWDIQWNTNKTILAAATCNCGTANFAFYGDYIWEKY